MNNNTQIIVILLTPSEYSFETRLSLMSIKHDVILLKVF